jgi:hypothetical protein
MDTRIQRVVMETAKFRLVGDVTLPTEGFRTRLTDVLNRQDTGFIPLVNVELSPLDDSDTKSLPFVAVARNQIEIAYELEAKH